MKKTKRNLYYQRVMKRKYVYVNVNNFKFDRVNKNVEKICQMYGIQFGRMITHSSNNANFKTKITGDSIVVDILGTKCLYVDWMNTIYFSTDKSSKYKVRRCRFFCNGDSSSELSEDLTSFVKSLPSELSAEEEFQYTTLYDNIAVMNKAFKFAQFLLDIKDKNKHIRPMDLILAAQHIGIKP